MNRINLVTEKLQMMKLINNFSTLPLLSFDADAARAFEQIQSQRIQLAKMDARIASIALCHKLILLTRNLYVRFKQISPKNARY